MLIDLNAFETLKIPNLNGGDGSVSAKMFSDDRGKIIISRIPAGSSIGQHLQKTGDDINYVISGTGTAICDGVSEKLKAGVCHICPEGSVHSIINTGDRDLVLFSVVAHRKKNE
ncbi:MAG: cupin domain-containing protein [Clostridia bacterium]|nr:cupin domain-containing protein [Clostridia bacterium]